MDIAERRIAVRDLFDGYRGSGEHGVVAYGGDLDVRPPYQREFVYKGHQRDMVIDTVLRGRPLNVIRRIQRDEVGDAV